MTLAAGDAAPDVTAFNQDGDRVAPAFDEPTVVYFYPRDDTPGCTIEANQFEQEYESYREAGVTVYGVSTDDVDSHRAFADQEDLDFDLLADPDGEVADAFGVDTSSGAAARTTFVIDDGEIQRVYTGVDPDGHARTVLGDTLDAGLATLDD
ncbi:peroxiredoxin [Halococcus saccharolyticus]|uniref:thioredoxin-dependent peroxiredoxin n=1 Tax=Halococcus saccharolyticus DSM 5350 TaxID=1227455 RepID=M0MMN1_9EURY|nr:peroxiredoxin [Halococcus saccharolyticus]EMA46947.1 alkyl hydroperoxide reductase/ thiol specific antioxidant/ Mal allergen [Halococcus saccharolyticus DSM 5350]